MLFPVDFDNLGCQTTKELDQYISSLNDFMFDAENEMQRKIDKPRSPDSCSDASVEQVTEDQFS